MAWLPTDGFEEVESKDAASVLSSTLASPADLDDPAAKDLEVCSLSSEWECPVCYQIFCEPIRAGCGRHIFCRNCLLKSQGLTATLRCPICRAESRVGATDLPEVVELVERLRVRDDCYDERVVVARSEREEHLVQLHRRAIAAQQERQRGRLLDEGLRSGVRAWLQSPRVLPQREVCGAGMDEANGVYVAGVLPTYVGPTVYRKPDTVFFIFRWQQTHWAIAELRGQYSMGDARGWLYRAPTQYPPDVPPPDGWEVLEGQARGPAPTVRVLQSSAALEPQRRSRSTSSSSSDAYNSPQAPVGSDTRNELVVSEGAPRAEAEQVQNRASCRCAMVCAVM